MVLDGIVEPGGGGTPNIGAARKLHPLSRQLHQELDLLAAVLKPVTWTVLTLLLQRGMRNCYRALD